MKTLQLVMSLRSKPSLWFPVGQKGRLERKAPSKCDPSLKLIFRTDSSSIAQAPDCSFRLTAGQNVGVSKELPVPPDVGRGRDKMQTFSGRVRAAYHGGGSRNAAIDRDNA